MTRPDDLADRAAFAERLRVQFAARHPNLQVEADPARLALRLRGPGVDVTQPLSPLHLECARQPERTAALIAGFVRASEARLTPGATGSAGNGAGPTLGRLLWCVRARDHLADFSRADELLTVPVAADLVAFVAETLPGSYMRGVPREEWSGIGDDVVRRAADANTAARFASLPERIRAAGRVARDGWRMSSDALFQGSVLMVPEVMRALVEKAGGEVLVAHPDRSLVLAIPAGADREEGFRRRVLRSWREAMHPVSRAVLVTDGTRLDESGTATARPRLGLMGWLRS